MLDDLSPSIAQPCSLKGRRIGINTEWLRLCRRPLLSTDHIRYCLLVTSERCLEGGRDRNGAPADVVFISY